MLICSLMDTGTSTSLLSHSIAKELHLDIIPADYITLKAADIEEMVINGISMIWLDIYEGEYKCNKPSTKKAVDIIMSESLDRNEELLISRASMLKLFLLLRDWPYKCDPSEFKTCILDKEDTEKIIKAMEQGTISRCLKAEIEEKIKNHLMTMTQKNNG